MKIRVVELPSERVSYSYLSVHIINFLMSSVTLNYYFHFQSLDYDVPDSDLILEEERSKGLKYETKKNISRWIVFMLIGVFTAGIGIILDVTIDQLSEIKYGTLKHCILYGQVFYGNKINKYPIPHQKLSFTTSQMRKLPTAITQQHSLM